MIKLGLTGGIGSGKSVVASLFSVLNIPVYIADIEAKKLTGTSSTIREQLILLFGETIYTDLGLNKPLLASSIFSNQENMAKVNAIIHPEVGRDFMRWVEKQTAEICVIESAILFESGFNKLVDKTLTVYAPEELRVQRVRSRDSISRDEVYNRINSQMLDELKMKHSDYVITNDDAHPLIPQVADIIARL